ncbi:MAG TPA: hypothetical protein PLP91_08610 [Plasticicumulans sp.]|nr:hypothetical protein [Plasticicumulans sp.]HMZ09588.1 hypothetical protein [Plasticicumulans sp.]HNB90434.1 hypothetical protein [Plasticicumulans sp.]
MTADFRLNCTQAGSHVALQEDVFVLRQACKPGMWRMALRPCPGFIVTQHCMLFRKLCWSTEVS